jgi:hypothetical protein
MSDEIGIWLNAGLGSPAGVYGEEMIVEAERQMGSPAAPAVDPSYSLQAAFPSCRQSRLTLHDLRFISLGCLVNGPNQFLSGGDAHPSLRFHPILFEDDGGHDHDPLLYSQVSLFVHIDFFEFNPIAEILFQVFEDGTLCPAWSAPVRIEIHQNELRHNAFSPSS